MLDLEGVIRKASLSRALLGGPVDLWLGRPWAETVATAGSGDTVSRMLSDAATAGVSAFAQVTQRFPNGLEIPIEYNTVRLGRSGSLLAIGKSVQAVLHLEARLVAAQRAREQDYWKLRELETRYRVLFDTTNDALVLLALDTFRIADANPAAIRAFGFGQGQEFFSELSQRDHAAVHAMLRRVRDHGRTPGILIHMGVQLKAWTLRASLLSTDAGSAFLLQFTALGAAPSIADLSGGPLTEPRTLLRQSGPDLCAPLTYLLPRNQLGQSEPETEPETPAADMLDTELAELGLIPDVAQGAFSDPQQSEESVIDRLGAASLPVLVREATESIERRCIEVALKRTGGKRSPAAVLLGLSRQSLHTKLVRYDMARAPWTSADLED